MKWLRKTPLILLIIFVLIQFVRIDTTNPDIDSEKDFLVMSEAPDNVVEIMHMACYDCHSNETEYPWYAQIAPVSWWLKHHVDEGKEHLNFSTWADYSDKKADHKLEECVEEVEEGEMPLNSYTWTHGDAKLTEDQKVILMDFFNSKRTGASDEED